MNKALGKIMSTSQKQISPYNSNNFLCWLILASIILFAVVVRLRLFGLPPGTR
jgi:hypothetical protein